MVITIPNRTHEDFGDSLNKLLRLMFELHSTNDSLIELDFNSARMLNPFFLGGLACTIRCYEQKGIIFHLNYEKNYNINSYLNAICFPGCHTPSPGSEDVFIEQLEYYKSKTYIPIIAFPTGNDAATSQVRENILSAVASILKRQLGFTDKNLMPIAYLLDEMTHNINDHSRAKEGFAFAQYYPASNYIDMCICDYGTGIYNSYLNGFNFHPKNEKEAIEFAINGKSTKERQESRGYGIWTSRKMLAQGLKGKFFLMSGNAAYLQTYENKGIINLPGDFSYQGNYIALRIPTIINPSFNIYDYVE